MTFKPIKKSYVSNQVYEQIKQAVINGEWAPGTKIPSENELAKMFSVSRISIREALHKLVTLGILETKHGEGTYVMELKSALIMNSLIPMLVLDKTDMLQILEFRRIMEVESARLAALRADEAGIEKLQTLLNSMHTSRDNLSRHSNDDLSFHFQIAQMTQNSVIIKVNFILKDILASVLQEIVSALGYSRGIYYHEKLFNAIKSHDSQLAKSIMEEHINNTISSMKDIIKSKENDKSTD